MRKEDYPFFSLEQLIDRLGEPDAKGIAEKDAQRIGDFFRAELAGVYMQLKADVFRTGYREDCGPVVRAYLKNIGFLITDVRKLLAGSLDDRLLSDICRGILMGLEALFTEVSEKFMSVGPEGGRQDGRSAGVPVKVLCNLSVDQIALLLKAADDIKLVSARSFSQVLQSVVPYLSTERMPDFSWKSARSSTYKMEAHDLDVAMDILESMLKKVRSYR
ncbi:hypothetical protein D0C36_15995 [Mucilaginibacter conchicola]|uniref:Uncharacterized protein n=1 Tax=Mucilaginibacter conchicola TaxID=2303333 RepID=A0A372NUW8_9SPHI|nr:hypothetical protein [Mucilaginibacter conchicola]RFZ92892.1 hypothetical protein D0C36_15995 [Mucilaginibacter conchicola]